MVNPYNDAKVLGAWKWMFKYHIKRMILSFLFLSIFIVAPLVGPYRIEETWLALLISGIGVMLNLFATFVQPYLIYLDSLRSWKQWKDNYDKGMYTKK